MESQCKHTPSDALGSIFVATVLAVLAAIIAGSSELGVIVWTTIFAWCFEGGATLERAQWVRSTPGEHSLTGFLKDALALVLWPLVARQIQRSRGRKK